jgi:CRP-like cAMP-binding protein
MSTNSLVNALKSNQFLRDFSPEYVEQLASISQIRDFYDGDVVFHEGDAAKKLYLIVSGAVTLKICSEGKEPKEIVTLGPGELLGWSTVTNLPRFAATAIVRGQTSVIEIDGSRVRTFCDADPKFGYAFLGRVLLVLSKRLISTWTQLADLYVPHYAPVSVGAAAENE